MIRGKRKANKEHIVLVGFMRFVWFIILITASVVSFGQGSKNVIDLNDYDRLIIGDSYNNNYQRFIGAIYEIDLTANPYLIYQKEKIYIGDKDNKLLDSLYRVKEAMVFDFKEPFVPDTIKMLIGEVNDSLVHELVNHLNHPEPEPVTIEKIFEYYDIDSAWLAGKKDSLFTLYLEGKERIKKDEKEFVHDVLSEFPVFKSMTLYKIMQRTTSHYPEVLISFESENDSVVFYNEGQYIFLVPWLKDSSYVNFDPDVSRIIGLLLPEQNFNINKKYLLPTKEFLINSIMEEIEFKSHFIKKR